MKRKNEIIKEKGRVYTPVFIVCTLLDLVGYNGVDVLKKNIIDNSCGDGAFLVEAVKRYCEIAIQQHIAIEDLKKDLENHAVEPLTLFKFAIIPTLVALGFMSLL